MAEAVAELAQRLAALADGQAATDWKPLVLALPDDGPLGVLAASAGIDATDASILLAAAAPAFDLRFGGVYAGLAGVTGPRRPAVADLLAVNGLSPWAPHDRARLGPASVLAGASLIDVEPGPAGLLSDLVGVPERVVRGLLGDDAVDAALAPLIGGAVGVSTPDVVTVARALVAGVTTVWIRDSGHTAASIGASALLAVDARPVVVDLRHLAPTQSLADVLPAALREAALTGGGVVVGPVVPGRDRAALAAIGSAPVRPVIFTSAHNWDPEWSAAAPLVVGPVSLAPADRAEVWQHALEVVGADVPGAATALASLRLGPEQIPMAVDTAIAAAAAAGVPVDFGYLRAGALGQGATRLADLARRVMPQATFDDLVVPAELATELQALSGRFATRHIVRDEWGLGTGGGRGSGLTCLFAGPSGTGKTLAAEVIANSLGVDLFVIDLSQIVDKYIGETEKNLERVFSEAEGVNGVLLFDEADALFGKRSEVQSSHDRHANVEVAYLLQRMERYDGVAILTTNLRGNIDEAFTRRLDVVCAFTAPTVAERAALWRLHLPPAVPQADDIDVDLLAESLDVSGGIIRNATISAAHAAAIGGRAVTMADLIDSARREYRKMGRLFDAGRLARLQPPDTEG